VERVLAWCFHEFVEALLGRRVGSKRGHTYNTLLVSQFLVPFVDVVHLLVILVDLRRLVDPRLIKKSTWLVFWCYLVLLLFFVLCLLIIDQDFSDIARFSEEVTLVLMEVLPNKATPHRLGHEEARLSVLNLQHNQLCEYPDSERKSLGTIRLKESNVVVDGQAIQRHENDVKSHPAGVVHLWYSPRALQGIVIDLRHPDGAEDDECPEENHIDPLEEDDLEEGQEVNAELHVLGPA
jgi:hypothetical protein